VIASPLAVIIDGGTQRHISQSVDVRLDASSSFDPDLEPNQQTQLSYRWRCESKPRNTTAEIALSTANVSLLLSKHFFVLYSSNMMPIALVNGEMQIFF